LFVFETVSAGAISSHSFGGLKSDDRGG